MCGMCVQCSAKSSKSGGGTAQMLVIKLINETWHEIFPLSFFWGFGLNLKQFKRLGGIAKGNTTQQKNI